MDNPFIPTPEEEKIISIVKSMVILYLGDQLNSIDQITHTSMELFSALESLHQLSRQERLWLYYASLLHDIGIVEGIAKHHIKTQNMVLDSKLLPFTSREKLIISCIARYHRKAVPTQKHDHFSALNPLDQRIVCILSGILRLSIEMNRKSPTPVSEIKVKIAKDKIQITCLTHALLTRKEEPQIKRRDLLESTLGKKITIKWRTIPLIS